MNTDISRFYKRELDAYDNFPAVWLREKGVDTSFKKLRFSKSTKIIRLYTSIGRQIGLQQEPAWVCCGNLVLMKV